MHAFYFINRYRFSCSKKGLFANRKIFIFLITFKAVAWGLEFTFSVGIEKTLLFPFVIANIKQP